MTLGVFHSFYAMGPGKVVDYLILGLNHLNINYKINELGDINLFLQGHKLIEVDNVNISQLFLGPNIADLPIFNNLLMQTDKYVKSIVPCEWVKNAHAKWIPENKIEIWNSGIDFNKYNNQKSSIEYDFLVYYKRRDIVDLNLVLDFLNKKNLKYKLLEYNHYNDTDFRDTISKSKYGFIIDGTETQGIAIQEMMSCNLPLLVWDIKEWHDRGPAHICPATSVPYFDETCGEVFYDIKDIEVAFEKLVKGSYQPREYILKNCNYITQTKKILQILGYAL